MQNNLQIIKMGYEIIMSVLNIAIKINITMKLELIIFYGIYTVYINIL